LDTSKEAFGHAQTCINSVPRPCNVAVLATNNTVCVAVGQCATKIDMPVLQLINPTTSLWQC
jgi:hypothetical protein